MSTRKTLTPKQKLRVINPRVKRGDYAKLAEKTGFHSSYVRRVLIGERNPNEAIINEAYKTIGRRKTVKS
jgi:transcriptional regulator with XRE-family HTH domain